MRPQDLIIDIDAMSQKQYMAVETVPNFPYINGQKSTSQDGYKTTVVIPAMRYEKLIVKTPATASPVIPVTDEFPVGGVPVHFENLTVTAYINAGNLGLSAKADRIILADSQPARVRSELAK